MKISFVFSEIFVINGADTARRIRLTGAVVRTKMAASRLCSSREQLSLMWRLRYAGVLQGLNLQAVQPGSSIHLRREFHPGASGSPPVSRK